MEMIVPNRLIACFKKPVDLSEFQLLHPVLSITKLHSFGPAVDFNGLSPAEKVLFTTVVITKPPQIISTELGLQEEYAQLKANPAVVFVQYDEKYNYYAAAPHENPNAWWFKAINCITTLQAHQVPANRIVKVAIIDTGVDHNHADLLGFPQNADRKSFTITMSGSVTISQLDAHANCDLDGHGTHVTGIIGALLNGDFTIGLANTSVLMDLRAFPVPFETTLAKAIKYAVDQGSRVINASWGTDIKAANPNVGSTIKSVIDYACTKGAVIVCAAGNNPTGGQGQDVANFVPAKFDNVITVGSIYPAAPNSSVMIRARSSNFGRNVIGAPGVGIASLKAGSNTQLLSLSGTSMATAFVSGLVARMLEKNPTLIVPVAHGAACNAAKKILSKIVRLPIQQDGYPIGLEMINVDKTLSAL